MEDSVPRGVNHISAVVFIRALESRDMPEVSMELSRFSFKRDHEDWIGPIEISMGNPGSCVVLTGINAGGKSLALRALEKFTKLLADPNRPNKDEFEALARVSGVDEISATYSFYFPEIDDFYFVEIADGEKLLSASGAPSGAEVIEDEFFYTMKSSIETRFTKDDGFTRRHGAHLKAEFEYLDDQGEPEVTGLQEQMFLKWEKVFDDSTKLAKDRMFSYGPDGFESEILGRAGIAVDPHGFEDHGFWDPDTRYQFVAKEVIMLQVDEAYRVSPETIENLRPFNENANAKGKGKSWINKRLKRAFDKCKEDFTKKWADEYRRKQQSVNRQISKLSEDIAKLEEAEEGTTDGGMEELRRRLDEIKSRQSLLGNSEKEYLEGNDRKKEFAEFLYPGRKKEYYVDDEGNYANPALNDVDLEWYKTEPFNWVSNPETPTVGMIITPAELKFSTPDFPDSIEGICARLMTYCPRLLQEYDPDMLFWIIVSGFIDFPDDQPPSYYSSGQRRMISMIEALMHGESGTVFLVDEPELSLHIDWQRRFIDQISVFSKRLVLATHSPDIIYGHTEKVVEVPPRSEV